jgi:hypothetical protein
VLLHEFAHAMGLGHFEGHHNGSLQLMASRLPAGTGDFAGGDIAGLSSIGPAGRDRWRAQSVTGHLDALADSPGTDGSFIQIVGWVDDSDLPAGRAGWVTVTIYGGRSFNYGAGKPRGDIKNGRGFNERIFMPPGVYGVCVTGHGYGPGASLLEFGCRTVTVTPMLPLPGH